MSLMKLDSNTAATTAALQMRLVKPFEDDTPDVDATPYSRWICTINEHFFNSTDSAGI